MIPLCRADNFATGRANHKEREVEDEMGLKALAMQIACTFPHNSQEQDMQIAEYVVGALEWLYREPSAARLSLAVVS